LVLETQAFEAVLGFDFIGKEPCGGILTYPKPCQLIFKGKEYPLCDGNEKVGCHKNFRLFKKESYSLHRDLRNKALIDLGISEGEVTMDMFANHFNHM